MTELTARGLARRLRRLDREGQTRFVAALWAAAGWSTAVRESRVVARRRSPHPERVELAVVTGRAGLARTLLLASADADVLVAPVGARTGRTLAARTGLEVVDAAAIYERLRYAVEPAAREQLLSAYVPDPRPTPSRRAVLSGVAAGALGTGAVLVDGADVPGMLPASGAGPVPGASTGTPVAGAESEDAGTPQGSADGGSTPSRTAAPDDDGCPEGPAATIARQVISMMEFYAPGGGTDVDGDGEIEYRRPETSDAFAAAVAEVESGPLRHAVGVSIGEPSRREDVAEVAAAVRTRSETVFYRFTLARTEGSCWRTRAAAVEAVEPG